MAAVAHKIILHIFQTYGFVWISTHGGGLVRYDGFPLSRTGFGGCRNQVCEATVAVMSRG